MSDERPPTDSTIIDLHPVAQLTRATVRGSQIAFEIQSPDDALARVYTQSLRDQFRFHFDAKPPDTPCPVEVKVDDKDMSKIIATYTTDGRPKDSFDDVFTILDALRSAKAQAQEKDVRGVRVSDNADIGIKRAFSEVGITPLGWGVTPKGDIRFAAHFSPRDKHAPVERYSWERIHHIGRRLENATVDVHTRHRIPISVEADVSDRSRFTVAYRPYRKRDMGDDMASIISGFESMGIPITERMKEGIHEAFTEAWKAHGHVATEGARRSTTNRSPGRNDR